jgi:hypothetical protein
MNLTHQERRSSLPIGLLENGQINSLCGKILRYMGDEQYSLACGRHLRGMISYIRLLFKAWFMQDYSLFRVWFKQVSLYMLIPSTNQIKYLEGLQA